MRNRGGNLVGLLLRVIDGALLMAALRAAYYVRFESGLMASPKGIPPLGQYLPSFLFALLLGLLLFEAHGLYGERARWGRLDEILRILRSVSLVFLVMMAATFFYREISFSRIWLGLAWALSLPAVSLGRIGMRGFENWIYRRGIGVRRVAILGGGDMGRGVHRKLLARPALGLVPVGFITMPGASDEMRSSPSLPAPFLGVSDEVSRIAREHRLDLIVVTELPARRRDLLDLVVSCQSAGVECKLVPDLFSLMTSGAAVMDLDGIPLISLRGSPFHPYERLIKRAMDVALASLGLLVMSPLMAVLALGVRLQGPGPAIYRQRRVGHDGRVFTMYKFRSMKPDAEVGGKAAWAREDDPRSTRLGRILRRTSLDELPQLWNVVRGEMSLVGPRPEREPFVKLFQGTIPRYLERLQVRSGVTGWAQVNGWRGNTSIEERTKHDIYYAENWSIGFDLKILLLTAGHLLARLGRSTAREEERLEPDRVKSDLQDAKELGRELRAAHRTAFAGARRNTKAIGANAARRQE